MATAEQLKALLKSYADGDEERFYAIAIQVAAHAARQGHARLALELRTIVDNAKERSATTSRPRLSLPIPLVQPRGDLALLLSATYPKTRLADMVLHSELHQRLQRILHEHRASHKLSAYGLSARRKILLVGPPGTGKTMSASALAGELNLPLFTILLDGLITKFMGETAAKLRLIFEAIGQSRGVYLFDEFDALGSERSSTNDVGEIRRVLNSFLQFLEQDPSDSLIVAATNHPQLLDRALFRRFDDVIEYLLPSDDQLRAIFQHRLNLFETSAVNWAHVVSAARGLSYSEITRACEDVAKEVILGDASTVTTQNLTRALIERRTAQHRPAT